MARSISQQNHLYSQFTHSDPVGCRHPAPTVMPSLPDPPAAGISTGMRRSPRAPGGDRPPTGCSGASSSSL